MFIRFDIAGAFPHGVIVQIDYRILDSVLIWRPLNCFPTKAYSRGELFAGAVAQWIVLFSTDAYKLSQLRSWLFYVFVQ